RGLGEARRVVGDSGLLGDVDEIGLLWTTSRSGVRVLVGSCSHRCPLSCEVATVPPLRGPRTNGVRGKKRPAAVGMTENSTARRKAPATVGGRYVSLI